MNPQYDVVIIGAGPAGLSAAYELTKSNKKVVVLERAPHVGGLAKTIESNGYYYDIGPHRFYTKNKEIQDLFINILGEDVIEVDRLTRILYRGKYFNYPLTALNALFGLGIFEAVRIVSSYIVSRLKRVISRKEINNFEEWVIDNFGERLYRIFFKNYTEKVWGIDCTEIGDDWASTRIKGLNLISAIRYSLFPNSSKRPKSLIDKFLYPAKGAGMLWDKFQEAVVNQDGQVETNREVTKIYNHKNGYRVLATGKDKKEFEYFCNQIFFSIPPKLFFNMLDSEIPEEIINAANSLRHRNHISVHITVNHKLFPDNWIYVHSPDLQLARVSDFSNFSKHMTKEGHSPLSVEYFCYDEDPLWQSSNEELIQLAFDEVKQIAENSVPNLEILDSSVTRSKNAYPVIEKGFQEHIDTVRDWLPSLENISAIGRAGMFKYNSQDHDMATGIYAARMYLGDNRNDPWLVNTDGEYAEEISE